jgi:hypothetical protein
VNQQHNATATSDLFNRISPIPVVVRLGSEGQRFSSSGHVEMLMRVNRRAPKAADLKDGADAEPDADDEEDGLLPKALSIVFWVSVWNSSIRVGIRTRSASPCRTETLSPSRMQHCSLAQHRPFGITCQTFGTDGQLRAWTGAHFRRSGDSRCVSRESGHSGARSRDRLEGSCRATRPTQDG